jgi:hypothetical protein
MEFWYNNKKLDGKTVSNYLGYLNDFVINTGLVGYLENINLKNPEGLSRRGIKFSYFNLITTLEHLRIINRPLRVYLNKTKPGVQPAYRYTINKPIYLFWLSVLCSLNSISKSGSVNLSRHNIKFDFTKLLDSIIGKGEYKGLIKTYVEIRLEDNNKYAHKWIVKHYDEILENIYTNLSKYLGKTYSKKVTKNIDIDIYITTIEIHLKETTNNLSINANLPPASPEASIYTSCQSLTFFSKLSNTWYINEVFYEKEDNFELLSLEKVLTSYQLQSKSDVIEKLTTSTINDSFYPIFIKLNRELSSIEVEILKSDLAHLFYKNCKILKLIRFEQAALQSMKHKVRFRLNIKIDKVTKFGYKAYVSGRQYNHLCSLAVIRRNLELKQFDYDGNYDFHSAIYSFARLINTGLFDVDWDIKNALVKKSFTNTSNNKIERDAFKKFSFRVFFASSLNQSYNWYKRAVKKTKRKIEDILPKVTESTYSGIYSSYQLLISDSKDKMNHNKPTGSGPYLYNIFVIESLAELMIMNQLMLKGVAIKNVFDCFYYKTSQINEFEVKNVITGVMKELYTELKYLKELGTKSMQFKDDTSSFNFRAEQQLESFEQTI